MPSMADLIEENKKLKKALAAVTATNKNTNKNKDVVKGLLAFVVLVIGLYLLFNVV